MAREKGTPATLNELIGKDKGSSTVPGMSKIEELLGEKMPEISMDRVGRFRLLRALRNRFGESFRNITSIKDILKDFDRELKVSTIIKMNRRK